MKGSLMGEPIVPVLRSTGSKKSDCGLAIHKKVLVCPVEVMRTELLAMGIPLPSWPIWVMTEGLQVIGLQIAVMAAVDGKAVETEPPVPTEISSGLVEE